MASRMWESFSGRDLEEAFLRSEDLTSRLPKKSGIYAWRRDLTPPSHLTGSGALLTKWVVECVKVPSAHLPRYDVAHFMSLDGVTIGGNSLTEDKVVTLKAWVSDGVSRKWVAEVMRSITDLAPPLYVGEAQDIPSRIKSHLAGQTEFAETLKTLGLGWANCRLYVCSIPEELLKTDAKNRRTLIEMIVARLAIAGCTTRPG